MVPKIWVKATFKKKMKNGKKTHTHTHTYTKQTITNKHKHKQVAQFFGCAVFMCKAHSGAQMCWQLKQRCTQANYSFAEDKRRGESTMCLKLETLLKADDYS